MRRLAIAAGAAAVAALVAATASLAGGPGSASSGLSAGSIRGLATIERRARFQGARGTVRADTLWSQALGIHKQVVVWLPPSYDREPTRRYPVAYYLHGLYGNEWNWVRSGGLDVTLDSLTAAGMPEMIVVMPDGDDGWYTTWNFLGDYGGCRRSPPPRESADTYCVPWPHYDDYIARDVVGFIDREYRTQADRARRGIVGLSMGGYGAVSLALAYPDVFSATGSHSGVLSPRYLGPKPFDGTPRYAGTAAELQSGWGRSWRHVAPAFGRDTSGWVARDPTRLAERLVRRDRSLVPAIMIDCGTDDELIDHSRAFRAELRRLGIEPTYAEWPGAHDWSYWRRHAVESARWLAARIAR